MRLAGAEAGPVSLRLEGAGAGAEAEAEAGAGAGAGADAGRMVILSGAKSAIRRGVGREGATGVTALGSNPGGGVPTTTPRRGVGATVTSKWVSSS